MTHSSYLVKIFVILLLFVIENQKFVFLSSILVLLYEVELLYTWHEQYVNRMTGDTIGIYKSGNNI